jgi:hypothetical protein
VYFNGGANDVTGESVSIGESWVHAVTSGLEQKRTKATKGFPENLGNSTNAR